ncbi:MAG: hypothetical protein LUC31_01925 [Coprobacillus sp.]|nr:hypothetical protein [Coprobacillus sp.]
MADQVTNEASKIPFEEKSDIKKLSLYVVVVNRGQGEEVIKVLQSIDSTFQILSFGKGTASKSVYDMLGNVDEAKDIIFAFVGEDMLETVSEELNAFLVATKFHRGVGFCVPLTSIVGADIYRLLSGDLSK